MNVNECSKCGIVPCAAHRGDTDKTEAAWAEARNAIIHLERMLRDLDDPSAFRAVRVARLQILATLNSVLPRPIVEETPHTCAGLQGLVHDCPACVEARARTTSADIAQRMRVLMRRDYSESEPYRTNLMLAAIERLEKTR